MCRAVQITRIVGQNSSTSTDYFASLITFSSDATVLVDKQKVLPDFAQTFEDAWPRAEPSGSTSYATALRKLSELTADLRPQTARIVVCFLSDGEPAGDGDDGHAKGFEEVYLNELRQV